MIDGKGPLFSIMLMWLGDEANNSFWDCAYKRPYLSCVQMVCRNVFLVGGGHTCIIHIVHTCDLGYGLSMQNLKGHVALNLKRNPK